MTGQFDFERFDALTFDCYGTLIDWEGGIVAAARTLIGAQSTSVTDAELLERFAEFEPMAEAGPFRSYAVVLKDVAARLQECYDVPSSTEEQTAFAQSVGSWSPFPDTVPALRLLAQRYRLAIVSNVDDALFAGSAAQLGVHFDEVVTAQQVRSYKPALPHFGEVLSRLELPKNRVLHVAQSLYHDIAPAKAFGLACVWVNRRAGKSGGGATPPAHALPDLEVPDLATLVQWAGLE